jgi:Protein of unknown function (DUF1153)
VRSRRRPERQQRPSIEAAITIENLPSAKTVRWSASRKAMLVSAVRTGLLSLEETCARYAVSTEEFVTWQRQLDREGPKGLRVLLIPKYRGERRVAHRV